MKMLLRMIVVVAAWLLLLASSFDQVSASLAQQEGAGTIVYNKPTALGTWEVWVINPDGSGDRRIPVSLVTAEYPIWSRDGQLIAATGAVPDAPSRNIFVFDLLGANLRRVTAFTAERDPEGHIVQNFEPLFKAFSPDGQQLAFVVFERVRGIVLLEVTSLDGAELTMVAGGVIEGFKGIGVDWSPRENLLLVPGSTIDWSSGLPVGVTALFAVEPVREAFERGLARQVTFPRGSLDSSVGDVLPVFAPDGRQIAFVRLRMPGGVAPGPVTSSIRVVNLDGMGEREVVLFPPGEVVSRLSWSGDGTRLVFDRGQGLVTLPLLPDPATTGLWMISLDGTSLHQLQAPPALYPSWNWGQ